MKKLDKLILVIFSVLILIETVIVSLLLIGWLDYATIGKLIKSAMEGSASNGILVGAVLCMILAIKCIFFDSSESESKNTSQGILMENENGKLMITKTTLENLVTSVVKDFDSAEDQIAKIEFDSQNNVIVDVTLMVSKNVIIKDLTVNMQNKIKEAIKKTSDLEVKEVNVKIKNIVSQDGNAK